MKLSEVVKKIKERLPIELVADQDNVGLISGDLDDDCGKMTVAYELNGDVLEEAANSGSNLIVTYHTPLYRPTRSFTTSNSSPDCLFQATRRSINVFTVHTALDVVRDGMNFDLASRLGLKNIRYLSPLTDTLRKIVVFVPQDHIDKVRSAMSKNGAGVIGNYSECAFASEGEGSFLPGEGSVPYVGTPGKPERTSEQRLEMVVDKVSLGRVVQAMLKAHPYEEVAYDVYPILNTSSNFGFGAIGELEEEVPAEKFLERVKNVLGQPFLKISRLSDAKIKRVAVCAGSGVPFYKDAVREGADIFITGDVKHHDFRESRTRPTVLADATHHGTERFAAEVLQRIMKEMFKDRFVINLSKHDYDSAVIV